MVALHRILVGRTRKQFFKAPNGKGKSRIIAGIIAGSVRTTMIDKVVVVFPSEILRKTDEKLFNKLAYHGLMNRT